MQVLDPACREKVPRTAAWYQRCYDGSAAVRKVLGDTPLCDAAKLEVKVQESKEEKKAREKEKAKAKKEAAKAGAAASGKKKGGALLPAWAGGCRHGISRWRAATRMPRELGGRRVSSARLLDRMQSGWPSSVLSIRTGTPCTRTRQYAAA